MLLEWSEEEYQEYKHVTSVKYPRVVTLSQINQMISQRLVDVPLEEEG